MWSYSFFSVENYDTILQLYYRDLYDFFKNAEKLILHFRNGKIEYKRELIFEQSLTGWINHSRESNVLCILWSMNYEVAGCVYPLFIMSTEYLWIEQWSGSCKNQKFINTLYTWNTNQDFLNFSWMVKVDHSGHELLSTYTQFTEQCTQFIIYLLNR